MVRRTASVFVGAVIVLMLLSACGGEAEIKYSYFSMATPVLSNIRDSNKIIKCEPVIVVKSEGAVTELEEKSSVVRDIVGAVLRELSEEDLQEPDTVVDDCKSKIMDRLVEELGPLGEEISDIKFNSFVWAAG